MFMQTDKKNINPHKNGQRYEVSHIRRKAKELIIKNAFFPICTLHQISEGFSSPRNSL